MSALSIRRPHKASREDLIRAKLAKLERLTGRQITLDYDPTTSYTEDPGSRGNVINGYYMDLELEEDHIQLDLRKGKLRKQLADELRRVAKMYRKLARRVEGGRHE